MFKYSSFVDSNVLVREEYSTGAVVSIVDEGDNREFKGSNSTLGLSSWFLPVKYFPLDTLK